MTASRCRAKKKCAKFLQKNTKKPNQSENFSVPGRNLFKNINVCIKSQ